ncbi:MAG TPA: bifunctional diaminohydroxyphosphoribosylaminopyrimidine deaminase/5-amino-6-(5-phosphoribosylamino)uracil reductase RibD [Candidatus Angelobacter sp.]|jgi:diaminohydroxyphosphoribosylaminopyrimidine deaminase/5-amino-6-(5-phosphoribosylamino)uracil reductase|nr:bifunctional diaminohydroxyphosphoribosylaminopyrimidine deaminase/5-amino-6-(5-phosphoribosylamino)uracil reductase RibD [Candidatus Angelobacter sp.]
MNFTVQDEQFMRRALELAGRGTGLTSPGARVGAVVVDAQGEIAGEGYYTFDGVQHAEVLALEQAGPRARGGDMYLNLEPHCYHSRTPPCTDAVIAAGIKRLVASMPDPNPQVSGKGFEKLRAAGVTVETGLFETEARRLNESFAKYILHCQPLVTVKSGMTLDGKIAPPPEESFSPSALGAIGPTGGWITSAEARAHVQELRHESDAIMVGVGTVIADDPLLTDRTGKPRRRPLLRAVLDSRLRLPLDSRLAKTVNGDLVVFCSFAEEKKRRALEERGIQVQQMPLGASDGRPDLVKIAEHLGSMEITSLLIEGGALVNWTALAAGIVDKVFLYYAPKILAGSGAVPFASGAGYKRMGDAAVVKNISIHRFSEDFAVEGYLRDPYERPPS